MVYSILTSAKEKVACSLSQQQTHSSALHRMLMGDVQRQGNRLHCHSQQSRSHLGTTEMNCELTSECSAARSCPGCSSNAAACSP